MKLNEIQLARLLDNARALVEEGKRLHAMQVYNRLVAAEPSFLLPYFELASLYAELGKEHASISILRQAQELFPENVEVTYHLGGYHLRIEEYEKALTLYKKLVGKKLPQVHFNMGVAYYFKNNFKLAEEQFRLTLKYDPQYPKINESLGELLLKRQAYTEAIDYLKRGIEKNPYSAVNHHLLGSAYGKIDDWKKAQKEFVLAVDMDPEQAANWQMCGESLIHLKRFTEAEPYLRKALELSPQSVETLVYLSQVLSAKGEMERAIEYIKKALNVDPKNQQARSMQWKLQRSKIKVIK